MPFWVWLLIDLGILAVGAVWWAYLAKSVAIRLAKTTSLVKPSTDAAQRLIAELDKLPNQGPAQTK